MKATVTLSIETGFAYGEDLRLECSKEIRVIIFLTI